LSKLKLGEAMVLGEKLRGLLRSAVPKCRDALTEDLRGTLEAIYGIHRSGKFEPAKNLPEVRADARVRETRELLERVLPDPPSNKPETAAFEERFDAVLRSLAFTHLNRLVAFKMLEHPSRRVIRETVGRGPDSNGFKFYLSDHPEDEALWRGGDTHTAYRNFLLWQCGQLNREIGILFDPEDLASRIFPGAQTLAAVLEQINRSDIAEVWNHEEAIGWVYQYYTPRELRHDARKSPAPRNSYEMAFRNQFYTPEYVVRFLVENTLGRMWLEMNPDSALREHCAYLVVQQDQSLPSRPKKDPRQIRVMDPACGSGHFLLYAFELFETIYSEAWEDSRCGPELRADFSENRGAFLKAVPKLIVENNLCGIDIDPRAVQLASLTLFVRAKSRSRDVTIERSNIACAEPIPGGRQLLQDFKSRKLKNGAGVMARVLDSLQEDMRLASEAGSLLRVEGEIQRLVKEEHERWRRQVALGGEQSVLFAELRKPSQQRLDFSDVSDEQFWGRVEIVAERLLQEYAAEAAGSEGAYRRIFAQDGIQSLRFIDLLSRTYDVVLMNPPFGEPTVGSKSYVAQHYPLTKNDVFAAFVEHWLDRLEPGGRLGAITSRVGFFLKSFTKWREEILLQRTHINVVADLGFGVLDTAMVETAAYVLERLDRIETNGAAASASRATNGQPVRTTETYFFRLLKDQDKETALLAAAQAVKKQRTDRAVFRAAQNSFLKIPGAPFAYWVSEALRDEFSKYPSLRSTDAVVTIGASTKDDFRWLRLAWEPASTNIASTRAETLENMRFVPFAKGGEFAPYYSDVHLLIDWKSDGAAVKAFVAEYRDRRGWGPHWAAELHSSKYYFLPGLTWPRRTDGLSFRVLPGGSIFADKGPAVFVSGDKSDRLFFLASVLNSKAVLALVHMLLARTELAQSYEVGLIQSLPMPNAPSSTTSKLASLGRRIFDLKRSLGSREEASHAFILPALLQGIGSNLSQRLVNWNAKVALAGNQIEAAQREIDELCYRLYDISGEDRASIESELRTDVRGRPDSIGADEAARNLLSWMVGMAMGRFDLRIASGSRPIPPLGDAFAPLPTRSPGMLPEGVVPSEYPFAPAEDGILLDDEGHEQDVVAKLREMFHLLFGDRAEAIEREALEMVGAKSLREYFNRSGKGSFWDEHVASYSKSRRRAPIYWLLQSSRGYYSVWLYSHRLSRDTLHKLMGQRYLLSRIERVKHEIEGLRPKGTKRPQISKGEERRLAELDDMLADLEDFQKQLGSVVNRTDQNGKVVGYEPELDDGVVLTAAPLHGFIPWPYRIKHGGRQISELTMYWQRLAEGEYDWARTAMHYWPDRVTHKCREDKSLALAHGLDEKLFPGLRDELSRQPTAGDADIGESEEPYGQEDAEETE
jgi:hypothetical protein